MSRAEILEYIKTVYRNLCVQCFESADHPHHIIPKSAGGTDILSNIVPLCRGCHEEVHIEGAMNHIQDMQMKAEFLREFLNYDG